MPKLKGLSQEQTARLLPDGLIFLGYRGSIAHGMYVPQSEPDSIDDKDLMGVFVAPLEHYLGFGRKPHKESTLNEWDVVSYELRKLVGLLLKGNPNVLSLLWLPDKHIVVSSPIAEKLRSSRSIFVSRKVYHSFNGYAYSQFKRMERFKREGYMGEKRKQLVERFGYDCKNAAHLIRLLRMGIEFLKEGRLYVERADAPQLLDIKRGKWPLEKVKKLAEDLFQKAESAYLNSELPVEPDRRAAEKLTMGLVGEFHGLSQRRLKAEISLTTSTPDTTYGEASK